MIRFNRIISYWSPQEVSDVMSCWGKRIYVTYLCLVCSSKKKRIVDKLINHIWVLKSYLRVYNVICCARNWFLCSRKVDVCTFSVFLNFTSRFVRDSVYSAAYTQLIGIITIAQLTGQLSFLLLDRISALGKSFVNIVAGGVAQLFFSLNLHLQIALERFRAIILAIFLHFLLTRNIYIII